MRDRCVAVSVGLTVLMLGFAVRAEQPQRGLKLLGEYQVPALEMEVGGIYPHPTNDGLYFLAANKNPAYTVHQHPKLPVAYRGKLLTVNRRSGEIVHSADLGNVSSFGGIASDGKRLFVSSLQPAEIVVWDLARKKVERRIALEAPAGGLEYDAKQGRLLAQIYVKHPHLAVIDVRSGATVDSLWSDESAMDLKLVDGDLLCTWASGFDRHAFSELRRIDPATGKVTGRVRLEGVHSSMAPLDQKVAGVRGFISLVTTNKDTGDVKIQKYEYDKSAVSWSI